MPRTATLAIDGPKAALREYLIDGIKTNIPLHLRILADVEFGAGRFSTNFLKRYEARREPVAPLSLAKAS